MSIQSTSSHMPPEDNQQTIQRPTCPRCRSGDLVRLRAPTSYRVLRTVGIPAKRYHCNDCRWMGMRVVKS